MLSAGNWFTITPNSVLLFNGPDMISQVPCKDRTRKYVMICLTSYMILVWNQGSGDPGRDNLILSSFFRCLNNPFYKNRAQQNEIQIKFENGNISLKYIVKPQKQFRSVICPLRKKMKFDQNSDAKQFEISCFVS